MEMEWKGGEDRKNCPGEDKKDLRGHSVFLKMIFGEEKNAKNPYYMPKTFPKTKKYFAKNIFGKIFGRIFGEIGGRMRAKNFKGAKCVKMKLKKCEEMIRTYDNIQTAY